MNIRNVRLDCMLYHLEGHPYDSPAEGVVCDEEANVAVAAGFAEERLKTNNRFNSVSSTLSSIFQFHNLLRALRRRFLARSSQKAGCNERRVCVFKIKFNGESSGCL